MARYEDTATPFAEAQFAGVRERKQQEARKQEKFAKKLLLAQTVAKGANELINNRADQLEANQTHIKAAYQNHIAKADQIRTLEDTINKSGRTATDFFQNSYYSTLTEQAAKEAKEQGLALTQQNFTLLRREAHRMAKEKAASFKLAVIQANDLPSLEDFQKNWEKHSKLQAPRTIFGAFTKAATNFFKKETPETLAYKEGKAKDALFATPLKNEFTEFETVYKTYDALGFDAAPVLDLLDQEDKRKVVKGNRQMISTRDYKNAKGGYVPKITTVLTEYEDGTTDTAKLNIEDSELIDNNIVNGDTIAAFMETVKPEFRESFYADIKDKAFITTDDFIDLQVRRIKEGARLTSVNNWRTARHELAEGYKSYLTTLVLTPELMEKYNLTAAQGHKPYTTLYEKNIETGEIAPKLEYGYILRGEGLNQEAWIEKGLDKLGIETIDDEAGGEVKENHTQLKGYTTTTFKITPQDLEENLGTNDESPLSIFGAIPVKNGFQTAKVEDVGLHFPANSKIPNQPGTIKINDETSEISYQLDETAAGAEVITISNNIGPTQIRQKPINISKDIIIEHEDLKLLDPEKIEKIIKQLDLSNLDLEQLATLQSLSIHDIKDKIGLSDDISKGAIFNDQYLEKGHEKTFLFRTHSNFKKAWKTQLGRRGSVPRQKTDLPDSFYQQIRDLLPTEPETITASL